MATRLSSSKDTAQEWNNNKRTTTLWVEWVLASPVRATTTVQRQGCKAKFKTPRWARQEHKLIKTNMKVMKKVYMRPVATVIKIDATQQLMTGSMELKNNSVDTDEEGVQLGRDKDTSSPNLWEQMW